MNEVARSYGYDTTTESETRGGRSYGHRDGRDARGVPVYGLTDRGAVSHQSTTGDKDTPTPERLRLDRVWPVLTTRINHWLLGIDHRPGARG